MKSKVYAYITFAHRLLVFRHTAYPDAGIQVPGGTVEPGESPEHAVVHEVMEETGLQKLPRPRFLGETLINPNDTLVNEIHHRYFYHFKLNDFPAENWCHWEINPSDGSNKPYEFEFSWVDPAAQNLDLVSALDAFIPRLLERVNLLD